MRISTSQQYFKSIDQMQRGQSDLSRLSDQISTGKKLLKPSDDPVAAAQVVKLERELAQYEKFDDNINVTKRRLELEDAILDDINIALDRIRELTIQAGNMATLNDQDRLGISKELTQLTDYVAGLMNTQDAEGEYLFAGSKGSTKPYESLENNRYKYNGDDGQRNIQVGADLYVPSNDSGQQLFEAVDGDLEVTFTGQAVYNAEQNNTEHFIRDFEFISTAQEELFEAKTQEVGDFTIVVEEPTTGNFVYSLYDSAGVPVQDDQGNDIINVAVGDLSASAAEVNLFGASFMLHEPADMLNGNQITLSTEREKINILEATVDLAEALEIPLESGENRTDLREALDKALDQFVQGQDRLLESRTVLGTRLSSLENITESNLDFELFTKSALSRLQDADQAEVISQFKLQEVTLQAAQATFSRVSNLSLFDYLR